MSSELYVGPGSGVAIVTRLPAEWLENRGSIPGQRQIFFSSSLCLWVMSISICEKTTTVIILVLQLVHYFIEGTDIDIFDVNITTTLVVLVLGLSNCPTPLSYCDVYLELELVLRPTVSRPVRLGIWPPFGAHDQILSSSFFFV
jgi:hypothetical protein